MKTAFEQWYEQYCEAMREALMADINEAEAQEYCEDDEELPW